MTNLINKFYIIIESIQNVIKWFPVIWHDRDWDHSYFYNILHFKLRNMEEYFNSEYVWGANALKDAKRIKTARILVKRLLEDNYWENAKEDLHHSIYMENQDREYLFDLMKKYINGWWD
jgi:hypothetical protein